MTLLRRDPRLCALGGAIALGFLVLVGQLWRIQIAAGAQYRQRAEVNRIRVVTVKPQRGVIYDRDGRQLARNVPSFTASIRPADLPKDKAEQQAVFERLSQVIDVPADEIRKIVDGARADPFTPVRIKPRLSRDRALILEEHHTVLPGVVVQLTPIRTYPEGPLFGQILGYAGPIPASSLESLLGQGYERDDSIGLAGLESSFEEELRGQKGRKQVEVDAVGRELGELATLAEAKPGGNLVLTIDAAYQRRVAEILGEAMAKARSSQGAIVAIQPQTGEVLAMVSLPQYDNNLFAAGISQADYARLSEDPWGPLLNHAIAGQYPPGSTFKMVTAAAALQEKVVTLQTPINCVGAISLRGATYRDWYAPGHGNVNVRQALAVSCDIYFYSVSGGNPYTGLHGLGIERLARYAHAFGFGEKSGLRLPGEVAGLIPTEEWKRERMKEPWYIGDNYNVGIGQGAVLATPLQLANMTAAIASGGTLYRPHLVKAIRDAEGNVTQTTAPDTIRKLPLAPEYLAAIRAGMRDAVAAQSATPTQSGTAYFALRQYDFPMAGKTGTAEYAGPRDSKGNLPTHALFVGFAPYDDPQIAVAVIVYGGGEGSATAAPVAAEAIKAFFELVQP
ncbi:MAG: penicillin-binding protein 2 [Chloroflexi bacterium]|nr:penicillin-binding protein 2 [Chloroflexota bacterium]